MHTFQARSNAWRLCANAHCPTDPNKAKHFPTLVWSTSLAPCQSSLGHKPSRTNTTTGLEPIVNTLTRILHALQSFVSPTAAAQFLRFHLFATHSASPPSAARGGSAFRLKSFRVFTMGVSAQKVRSSRAVAPCGGSPTSDVQATASAW